MFKPHNPFYIVNQYRPNEHRIKRLCCFGTDEVAFRARRRSPVSSLMVNKSSGREPSFRLRVHLKEHMPIWLMLFAVFAFARFTGHMECVWNQNKHTLDWLFLCGYIEWHISTHTHTHSRVCVDHPWYVSSVTVARARAVCLFGKECASQSGRMYAAPHPGMCGSLIIRLNWKCGSDYIERRDLNRFFCARLLLFNLNSASTNTHAGNQHGEWPQSAIGVISQFRATIICIYMRNDGGPAHSRNVCDWAASVASALYIAHISVQSCAVHRTMRANESNFAYV